VIPLVGASSVAQLDETLVAVDLELTADRRTCLDVAQCPNFSQICKLLASKYHKSYAS
jgi:hypothetical protein